MRRRLENQFLKFYIGQPHDLATERRLLELNGKSPFECEIAIEAAASPVPRPDSQLQISRKNCVSTPKNLLR